jgi:hypothetical protein
MEVTRRRESRGIKGFRGSPAPRARPTRGRCVWASTRRHPGAPSRRMNPTRWCSGPRRLRLRVSVGRGDNGSRSYSTPRAFGACCRMAPGSRPWHSNRDMPRSCRRRVCRSRPNTRARPTAPTSLGGRVASAIPRTEFGASDLRASAIGVSRNRRSGSSVHNDRVARARSSRYVATGFVPTRFAICSAASGLSASASRMANLAGV